MNYMKQVAQLLGVEIGEEFKIEGRSGNHIYKLTEENIEYLSCGQWFLISNTLIKLLNGKYKVVKIPNPVLDDVEKKYLSKVIRPFRDRIVYISKENVENSNKEYIYIGLWGTDKSTLPPFERETMYKGMIVGKRYHLKELGL